MIEIWRKYMLASQSYVAELEHLITDLLLPVFDKYYRERGLLPEYTRINPQLLKQIKKRKVVPALFKPKEKQACKSLPELV
jgi:hypothetical protein